MKKRKIAKFTKGEKLLYCFTAFSIVAIFLIKIFCGAGVSNLKMSIEKTRTFDVDAIHTLKEKTISLLDQAEDTRNELIGEMDQLLTVLNNIPSNLRDYQLQDDAIRLRDSLRNSNYNDYKNQIKKELNRICTNVPQGDYKMAQEAKKISASLKKLDTQIKDLTQLLPKVTGSKSTKDFQKALEDCTGKWERQSRRKRLWNGLRKSLTIPNGKFYNAME